MSEKKLIALVLCRHGRNGRKALFYAPAAIDLERGQKVLVETFSGGTERATVCKTCVVEKGSDAENMIRYICHARNKKLKKVIGKLKFIEIGY